MNTQLQDRRTPNRPLEGSAPEHPPAGLGTTPRGRRRLPRWIVGLAAAGLAAGAVVAVNATTGDATTTPPTAVTDDLPAFDSPGGHSMRISSAPGPVVDGPNGNAFDIPSATSGTAGAAENPAWQGPGSNSLSATRFG